MNVDSFNCSREQWEHLIDQWILGKNGERDRNILKRRLLDGLTFERLAEEFKLSRQRVQAIVYKRQEQLFKRIK